MMHVDRKRVTPLLATIARTWRGLLIAVGVKQSFFAFREEHDGLAYEEAKEAYDQQVWG
jgi:hypothetical protein